MALVTASCYPQSLWLSEQENLWFYFSFLAKSLKVRHPHFGQEIHSQTWLIPLTTCYFTSVSSLALISHSPSLLPCEHISAWCSHSVTFYIDGIAASSSTPSSPLTPAPAAPVHLCCHQPVAATKLACLHHKPCNPLMAKKRLPNASLFLKPMSPNFFFSPNTDHFCLCLQNLCFCFKQVNFLWLERGFFIQLCRIDSPLLPKSQMENAFSCPQTCFSLLLGLI